MGLSEYVLDLRAIRGCFLVGGRGEGGFSPALREVTLAWSRNRMIGDLRSYFG